MFVCSRAPPPRFPHLLYPSPSSQVVPELVSQRGGPQMVNKSFAPASVLVQFSTQIAIDDKNPTLG